MTREIVIFLEDALKGETSAEVTILFTYTGVEDPLVLRPQDV
jgi:hypothetical protein